MSRLLAACSALLWAMSPCVTAYAAESTRVVVSPLATLGKLAVALIVVLGVFWVFARVMRQFQVGQSGAHSGLKIIGGLSLGQRERVVVIQAGEDQLLLGVTATQINILHTLTSPLSVTSPQDVSDFRQKLSDALKKQVAR